MILLLELKVCQEKVISIHPVESPVILRTKGCNDSQLLSKVRVNRTELFTSQPHSANLPDVCDKCYSALSLLKEPAVPNDFKLSMKTMIRNLRLEARNDVINKRRSLSFTVNF